MKHFNITYLFLFFTLNLFSQNTLKGIILDNETNEPMPQASVYFPDLKKGTTSDLEGFYQINDLPAGAFLVEVSYVGYSSVVAKINVSGEIKHDFILKPKITEMGEVVVTGMSSSTERKLNPIPTIVINNLANHEGYSTNLVDAISKQPGISQITTGTSISKPVIRGLGYNRVVVLNNHIRQEGQQWGDEHGLEMDEYSIERVEIIKGPGSLIYGSDAMAGVINFIQPQPVEEGRIIGNVRAEYQANADYAALSAMTAGNLKGKNWLLRASGKKVGNYENSYDGKVFNSGFDELAFNGMVGVTKKWGYTQLFASNFSQNLGLVEGERDSLGNFTWQVPVNDSTVKVETVPSSVLNGYHIEIPSQKINQFMVSSNSKIYFGRSGLIVNLAFQQNQRKEFADILAPDEAELYFKLNTVNYEFRYIFPVLKGWETSAGLSGMWQTSQNLGAEFLIPEYSLLDGGIFIFTQKTINKLHLSGGIRYDLREVNSENLYLDEEGNPLAEPDENSITKFESFKSFFSSFSGSLGASYDVSEEVILKLNLAKGFRAPNIAELGSNGVHEGTFHYEIGNPNLKEESSFQLDAGLILDATHVSLELAGFANWIQNFIFLEKLSNAQGGDSIVDPFDPVPAYQFVQGNSLLYGGEIALDIHPHPWHWLHFENSFSYVRGIQLDQPDSTMNLPQMPAPRFRTELRGDFKKWGSHLKNLLAYVNWLYAFQQNFFYEAENTETTTPSYNIFNVGIGGDIVNKKGNTLLSVGFIASNLFNYTYQDHLSRLKYSPKNQATGRMGVFNMGRNFSVNVSIPLQFRKS